MRAPATRWATAIGLIATVLLGVAPPTVAGSAEDRRALGATETDLVPVNPARLLDTRPGNATIDGRFAGAGRLRPKSTTKLTIAGRGGVPANAAAAFLNLTATNSVANGFAVAYPCGPDRPTASSLNYVPGQAVANGTLTPIGQGGQVCLYNHSETDLIVDVNGYLPSTSWVAATNPLRLVDSRDSGDTFDGFFQGGGPVPGGFEVRLPVANRGAPATAGEVFLNVTATNASRKGNVGVYPCGSPGPSSNLNFRPGASVANGVIVGLSSPGGDVCFRVTADVDLIVDINGFGPPRGSVQDVFPSRPFDSRVGAPIPAGSTTRLKVTDIAGVPANADAVFVNVTGVDPSGRGFVTVYPCGRPRPTASNLNVTPGQNTPNRVLSRIGTGGAICLYNHSRMHLVVDINGYNAPTPRPVWCSTSGFVSDAECGGLEAMYLSLAGPYWNVISQWGLPVAPCAWDGVMCADNAPGTYVRYLVLEGGGLIGEVPPEISVFQGLEELLLADNVIWDVPAEIGDLPALERIDLSDNYLSTIRPEFADLPNLDELDLSGNDIAGDITAVIGTLRAAHPTLDLKIGGYGCPRITNATSRAWVEARDPFWDEGCDAALVRATPDPTDSSALALSPTP